jgi:hypothetical protein
MELVAREDIKKAQVTVIDQPVPITLFVGPSPSAGSVWLEWENGGKGPLEPPADPNVQSEYLGMKFRVNQNFQTVTYWTWIEAKKTNSAVQVTIDRLQLFSPTPAAGVVSSTTVPNPAISVAPSNPDRSIDTSSSDLATNDTTAPAASVTPFPSKSSSNSKGLSPGAVAGVAIGCLLGGALLAGLAVWFCLGRARRRRRVPAEHHPIPLIQSREKGPVATALSLGSSSPMSSAMDSAMPQPLEDKIISSGISAIGNAIKNHTQSFYHSNRVSPGLLDLDDLHSLGSDLPLSTGTLSTLLCNPDTREIALRFCIGWVVVSRMQFASPPDRTFLPPELGKSFRDMTAAGQASRSNSIFLSKWRVLTAELTRTTYAQNTFSSNDPRHGNIEKAITAIDGILRPYADIRMDNSQRVQNLRELFKRAAAFSFTLFSQPSVFEYDWQEDQGVRSGSLCIFPSLVQVVDELGEPVKPPRAFSEATARPLGV